MNKEEYLMKKREHDERIAHEKSLQEEENRKKMEERIDQLVSEISDYVEFKKESTNNSVEIDGEKFLYAYGEFVPFICLAERLNNKYPFLTFDIKEDNLSFTTKRVCWNAVVLWRLL